eukprot:CCRYP_005826-RA/>CCRYP_005826-RA protein AED:0.00 eAED:0.00 QI:199/1/1/1/0/0/2/162/142
MERSTIIMSLDSSISVPTFSQKMHNRQRISRNIVSSQDLALMKKSDPFLYFSIPAVRNAVFLNGDLDPSTVDILSGKDAESSLSEMKDNRTFTVKRKSRVSFECHVDVIFEHMLNLNSSETSDNNQSKATLEDVHLSVKSRA